jgi:hypothetical protein
MTAPKRRRRPSRAALQRAYARDLAKWEAGRKQERRQLWGYFLAGALVWVILEQAPDRHWLTPWAVGLAVWAGVGWVCELARASRGD